MMNRYERPTAQGEAAVTGKQIPLAELRYWSVERQEAYGGPEIAAQVYEEKLRRRPAGS